VLIIIEGVGVGVGVEVENETGTVGIGEVKAYDIIPAGQFGTWNVSKVYGWISY